MSKDETTKVLGIHWKPDPDILVYNVNLIETAEVKRHLGYTSGPIELHAFSDASIKVYSVVVYSRVKLPDGSFEVCLLAAKTRVAIPITIHAWSDSTIVLAWLSLIPSKLKTFVANRTAEILEIIPRHAWHHVNTKQNPADCASRGMMASELLKFDLWWKGPEWLHDDDLNLVTQPCSQISSSVADDRINEEVKTITLIAMGYTLPVKSVIDELADRTSSWLRLVRIMACVLRFIRSRGSQHTPSSISLYFEEIFEARTYCVQHVQAAFEDDGERLKNGRPLRKDSKLRTLSPILDNNGLLRVGGRLSNSELTFSAKHPVIMPKTHRITYLIVENEHRVRQAYPFQNTGCDYAGPMILKVYKGRNPRKEKGYICLFVCMVTSALHLELATDLSTETFLAPLRRFISRRGKCTELFSDNGRNFVGVKRQLNEMEQLLRSQLHNDTIEQALASEGIKWNFIPPHAPHWGGKWESAVRSVKMHLHRVLGNATLTFEQMHTLLAQVEAVVNSRPLYSTSDTDLGYLSPAHLLIGRLYTLVPEGDLGTVPTNRLSYWQHSQSLLPGF
ncbi:uncharacterized protein [Drosophila takahashii]|uniref:uncharacterized protein n=1 Tax=Drosophila takahashii TaxID=29030 RepID=UPI00389960BA